MGAAIRWIGSLRLYLVLLTAPYALLWTTSPQSGGALMLLAHTALVWFYALSVDEAFIAQGLDPRLSLVPDRHVVAHAPIGVCRAIAGCAVALLALFLLFAGEPRLALLVAAGGAGVAILVRTAIGPDGRRRFLLAELVWAGVMLMGPCVLVGAPGWSTQRMADALPAPASSPMSAAVVAATGLGALMLGVWAILCMRRDAPADRAIGLRTTATVLGPGGSLALLALWIVGAVAVSAWGVSQGWWGWIIAAIVAWAAAAIAWTSARGSERAAVHTWTLAALVVAFGVSAQVWAPVATEPQAPVTSAP